MVAYTKRVVWVYVALIFFAYDEYFLWYVPPNIIRLAGEHGIAMKVPLGLGANVLEVLQMMDII